MPSIEETFACCAGRWRVVDTACDPDRPANMRFAVMARPLGGSEAPEIELCAVQYRPHAEAIAAVPDMALALFKVGNALEFIIDEDNATDEELEILEALRNARAKAEGRA